MGTHSDDLLHLLLKVLVQHPGEQGRGGIKRNGLSSLLSRGRKHQTPYFDVVIGSTSGAFIILLALTRFTKNYHLVTFA